jgi:hypothetical protein
METRVMIKYSIQYVDYDFFIYKTSYSNDIN